MVLPNFIVMGAPKSGTTNLCFQLAQHPDIFLSTKKELDFFNRQYRLGQEWYEQQFATWNGETAVGEGSVLYGVTSLRPEVPQRISKMLPESKFIYMARHPIDRIESMWVQHLANGDHVPDFNKAVREWLPLMDGSMYWKQLNAYRRYFDDEKFLILFLDDYIADTPGVLQKAYDFVGVSGLDEVPELYTNAREGLPLDVPAWKMLRHTPIGRAIRSNFSENIKDVFRRVFRKRMGKVKPKWEEGTLRWAIDFVKEDAQQFLAFAQRPQSEWDFSEAFVQSKLQVVVDEEGLEKLRSRKQPFVLSHVLDYENLGA